MTAGGSILINPHAGPSAGMAVWRHAPPLNSSSISSPMSSGWILLSLRLKNAMEEGDITCNDFNVSSFGMRECLEAVRDGSGWNEKRGKMPRGKGVGAACGFFVSGAGYPIYRSDTAPLHCGDQAQRGRWHGAPHDRLRRDRPGL